MTVGFECAFGANGEHFAGVTTPGQSKKREGSLGPERMIQSQTYWHQFALS